MSRHQEQPRSPVPKGLKIIDISDIAEQEAQDRAEKELHETKRENNGVTRWERFVEGTKNLGKNVALGLTKYYRRNKALREVRSGIETSGNIYSGRGSESHDKHDNERAINAIMNRFDESHSPDEVLQLGERVMHARADQPVNTETAQFKSQIFDLIGRFASTQTMTEEQFNAEKLALYNSYFHGESGAKRPAVAAYADNALEIAQSARSGVIHIDSLKEIESSTTVTLGIAKSKYKTQANFNIIDKTIDSLQRSQLTSWISPTIISAGAATAIGLMNVGRGVAMKGVNLATFGLAGAAVTGAISGFNENTRLKGERATVARSLARGEQASPEAARRIEMGQYVLEMRSADDLITSFRRDFCDGDNKLKELSEGGASVALKSLAEIEARIKFRDTHNVDTISYAGDESETLHTDLMVMRAQMKVQLARNMGITTGELRQRLTTESEQFLTSMATEKTEKDRLERDFRLSRAIKTGFRNGAIGLGVGMGIQEVTAFFNNNTEGLVEHFTDSSSRGVGQQTYLHALAKWIHGDTAVPGTPSSILRMLSPSHTDMVALPGGGSINVNLPTGYALTDFGGGNAELSLPGGVKIPLMIDPTTGNFDSASLTALHQAGLQDINGMTNVIQTTATTTHTENAHQYLQGKNLGPDWYKRTKHLQRWLANDTPMHRDPVSGKLLGADFNELRAYHHGVGGSGFTASGDAQLRIDMKEFARNASGEQIQGSIQHGVIGRAAKAVHEGRMFWELTPEKGGPTFRVPFHVNTDGTVTADIPKTSPIYGMVFGRDSHGHMTEKAWMSEIIEERLDKTGKVRDYLTYASQNHGGHHLGDVTITDTVIQDAPEIETTITALQSIPTIVPGVEQTFVPFIPVFWGGRKELERAAIMNPFLYGYNGNNNKREDIPSEALRKDPDAKLNAHQEISNYLASQSHEYRTMLQALSLQIREPMSPETRVAIAIPAAGHQEGKNIYETLTSYSKQTADPKTYELVVFVNYPMTDKDGSPVKPDATYSEILRFKKDYPNIPVRVMQRPLLRKDAKIGNIRKILNDSIMLRQQQRGKDAPDLIVISNDADNKGISQNYIEDFIKSFDKNPKKDAFMGNLDWDPEALIQYPEIFVGAKIDQYLTALNRKHKNKMTSSGANFAFRSSMYAAVGGYDETATLAEDVTLGRAIMNGRRNNGAIGYNQRSLLYTSARRSIAALKQGHAHIEQWDQLPFGADDELRKNASISSGSEPDFNDPTYVNGLKNRIESIVDRTLSVFSKWDGGLAKDDDRYKKVLKALGISYKITKKGGIEITDMQSFVTKLKQNKALALLRRDNIIGIEGKREELIRAKKEVYG
jgi:hypothetical protein